MMSKFNKIRGLVTAGSLAAATLILLGVGAEAAPRPVAIVEDSAIASGKGQVFELLSESDVVKLGAGETLVLGYLKSCIRETITGGTVTIGAKESVVEGCTVAREKTQCAVNKLALTSEESQQSATIAFRGQIKHIFTRQPLVIAAASETVTIEPMEGGEAWKLKPENGRIDFRAAKSEMQPGMNYRVTGEKTSIMIEVDAAATTAKTGALERVVILEANAAPTN
jgi:hypothetical protein